MLWADDKEALMELEMGQNKDSVHGRGEQRQIAGTRDVSSKCFHSTHIASCGQPPLGSHQSQKPAKPATAQQGSGWSRGCELAG